MRTLGTWATSPASTERRAPGRVEVAAIADEPGHPVSAAAAAIAAALVTTAPA